jgi:integrase
MVIRKRGKGWQYDFWLLGKRERKGRFRTKAEATAAEKLKREEMLSGKVKKTFREAYEAYIKSIRARVAVTTLEDFGRFMEREIAPTIGHVLIGDVNTSAIVELKQRFPPDWGPKSINQRLILVRAVLRFCWACEWIPYPPKVPMEKVPKKSVQWYELAERDAFLEGVYELQPQWYLFFYLTSRLGLRRGEVYPIEHSQFLCARLQLAIDKAVIRGTSTRDCVVRPARKGGDTMTLEITQDIVDAYRWHVKNGYAGDRLVFCPTDKIPRHLDSHVVPMKLVQAKLGLRKLTHHKLGRHSVGSQADDIGATHKAIQRQLGHQSPRSTDQYVHGSSKAQRAIVEALRPKRAPHEPPLRDELN